MQRWFFKRRFQRYAYGSDTDSISRLSSTSRSRAGSNASNDSEDFVHIALSYNLAEGKHSFQSVDHTILKHKPCGPACDLQTTMRLWQALPDLVKQSVSTWVEETYKIKSSGWNLHSAIPVANNTPRTRKLLQRLVLGASARETAGGILLVLASSERPYRSGSSTSSERTASSSASNSPKPASKEDVKRLQAELAVMAAEVKLLRTNPVIGADEYMPPIKFKDAVGRQFTFPWRICKTWKGMEGLIKQAFLHVDVIGPHVQEGHYDLMGPDGTIILPQLWETMIRPDWDVTMYMWPLPEPPKKEKKTKKTNPVFEPPIGFDPNSEPIIQPFHEEVIGFGPSTSITKKKGKKTDKSKASNPFSEPILEAYPPMPPMPSESPQSAPVVVEMPSRMRHAALEERIKELDREVFPQRQSTRAAKNVVPEVRRASVKDFNAGGGRISPTGQNDENTKDDRLNDGIVLPGDSDAEDALLDDEALKNKMLMKYAGGVATVDEPEPDVCRNRCSLSLEDDFTDPASSLADRVLIGDVKHSMTSGAHEHTDPDP